MYEEKVKGFLEELQSLGNAAKKRVLIISTLVIMIIVFTIWLSYFNGIVASAGQPSISDTSSTVANSAQSAPANGPSIWQNIGVGVTSIGNIFKGHSDYTIQPQNNQ